MMNRYIIILLSLLCAFSLMACTGNQPSSKEIVTSEALVEAHAMDAAVEADMVRDEPSAIEADITKDEQGVNNTPCDSITDKNCIQIQRGESIYYRRPAEYKSFEYNDKGITRTVIRLSEMFDANIAENLTKWRYSLLATDGYTFGGYASWDQITQGYLELGSRRVMWEPILELPDSWRVKDLYKIVLSPTGANP